MKILKQVWNFVIWIWNLLFWVGEEFDEPKVVIFNPRNMDKVRTRCAVKDFETKKRGYINA